MSGRGQGTHACGWGNRSPDEDERVLAAELPLPPPSPRARTRRTLLIRREGLNARYQPSPDRAALLRQPSHSSPHSPSPTSTRSASARLSAPVSPQTRVIASSSDADSTSLPLMPDLHPLAARLPVWTRAGLSPAKPSPEAAVLQNSPLEPIAAF